MVRCKRIRKDSSYNNTPIRQPPPQALRFSHGEASAKRVTGDEPQGTMGRVQSPVVSFPPSFARTFSSKERRLGTRQVLLWVIIESVCIDSRGILSTPACDVHVRLKTNGTAIKIAKKTTNNQDRKYNSVRHLQRQQFLFTKTK